MDELDLLKKDWNRQDKNSHYLSIKEIYPMLHKKSSSIVKTLFYISIAEFVFWLIISLLPSFSSEEYRQHLDAVFPNETLVVWANIFSYSIILIFIYLLFKSYKSISVTDNAKKLMESIIKTRKIIKYYVIYNLVMFFLSGTVGMIYSINFNPEVSKQFAAFNNSQLLIFIIISILFIAVVLLVLWLFYKIIYGLLLKRLNKNYNELQKLEV
jgi:hypothetical protein